FLSAVAWAEELTPELVARINAEQKTAVDAVNKKHGNRKPSQMDQDERSQVIAETAAAQQGVLDKHGVSAKDFARYEAKLSLDDRKRQQAEEKRIKDEKQAKEAKSSGTGS